MEFFTSEEIAMCLHEVLEDYPSVNYHIVNFSVSRGEFSRPLKVVTLCAFGYSRMRGLRDLLKQKRGEGVVGNTTTEHTRRKYQIQETA